MVGKDAHPTTKPTAWRWGEAPPYEAVTLYSAPVLAFVQLRL